MKTIYEHPTVTLSHHIENDYILLKWKGTVEINIYKEALLKCLEYIGKEQIHCFFIDQTELEYVGSEAQAWLYVNWFPKLEKVLHENIYFAILTSKKMFVELASKVIARKIEETKQSVIIQYFKEATEAENWLKAQDKSRNIDF